MKENGKKGAHIIQIKKRRWKLVSRLMRERLALTGRSEVKRDGKKQRIN